MGIQADALIRSSGFVDTTVALNSPAYKSELRIPEPQSLLNSQEAEISDADEATRLSSFSRARLLQVQAREDQDTLP